MCIAPDHSSAPAQCAPSTSLIGFADTLSASASTLSFEVIGFLTNMSDALDALEDVVGTSSEGAQPRLALHLTRLCSHMRGNRLP